MDELKELSIALARIVLGIIILIGGLIAVDILIYLSVIGTTFNERVAAAYDGSYDTNYTQTYEATFQEAHSQAYDKGIDKGYEIGLGTGSEKETATRVELYNPTSGELKEFLADDKTDSSPYIKGEYIHYDFSAELNNNAEASSIRAAYVLIRSEDWEHAIVAFETVDRGLVFIEPQSDREVKLVLGERYPWAIRTSTNDDVVVEIQIIW